MKTYSYTVHDLTNRSKQVRKLEIPHFDYSIGVIATELEVRKLINYWNHNSTLTGEKDIRWLYVLDPID